MQFLRILRRNDSSRKLRFMTQRSFFTGSNGKQRMSSVYASRVLMFTVYLSAGAVLLTYLRDNRAMFHSHVLVPLLHKSFDPEVAHKLSVWFLSLGLCPKEKIEDPIELQTEDSVFNFIKKIFGLRVSNPIWLAAGFDKDGEAIDSLLNLGFGAVEIGSITPQPQPGNSKPRVFRLNDDRAIINRYGFNSDGCTLVAIRLKERFLKGIDNAPESSSPRSLVNQKLLGISIGKNKASEEGSVSDYITGINVLSKFADYLVLNISSPNTPVLVEMQKKGNIERLLEETMKVKSTAEIEQKRKIPLCVKLSPDLTDSELDDVLDVIIKNKVDGIIVANTTAGRPCNLRSEVGGLSGRPIKPRALNLVQKTRARTLGKIPIIACGGVESAQDVLEFGAAGADIVQLYTSLIYEGPGIATKIKLELADILRKRNMTWKDVVNNSVFLNKDKLDV